MAVVMKRPLSVSETVEQSTSNAAKKIRIQATSKSRGNRSMPIVALLEGISQNAKELLEVLVKIADELNLNDVDVPQLHEAISKLVELFRQDTAQSDTTIRVKILGLLADLAEVRLAEIVNLLIDEIIVVLKQEKSQKVIAQGLYSLHKIGARNMRLLPSTHVTKIAFFAQQNLTSESHQAQKNALMVLSAFTSLIDAKKGVIDTIGHYADSQDSGVRAQALRSILCLGERGATLAPNTLYKRAVDAMRDDYECVRKEALQLVFQLGTSHPDYMIVNDEDEEIRLIDAAFGEVCGALCDLSIQIRIQVSENND